MNKTTTDIRVKKTKRAIYRAFASLLGKKPISKITVTELAGEAEINKGTFYLHYKDIYDLYEKYVTESVERFLDGIDFYELFFDNPKEFLAKLIKYYELRKAEFPELIEERYNSNIPIIIVRFMSEELYKTERIERSPENDNAIEFIIYATIGMMFSHNDFTADINVIGSTAAKAIEALFGQEAN